MSPITERLASDFARTFASPVEYEWDGWRKWERVTRVPGATATEYRVWQPGDADDEVQTHTALCPADAAQEYVMYWLGSGEHTVIVDGVQYYVSVERGYASVEVAS